MQKTQHSSNNSLFTKILSALVPKCLTALKKQSAFTLAETLIVMGIIGVVAALTLPNLNSSTGDKEKVAKVKKIYQNLTDAVGRAEAVYGPIDEWCVSYEGSCHARIMDRITEFMKVTKKCDDVTSCGIRFGDYTAGGRSLLFNYVAILADGSAVGFSYDSTAYNDYIFKLRVDIDGPYKGQGRSGFDTFAFAYNIKTKNLVPQSSEYYMDNSNSGLYVSNEENDFDMGAATTWVVNFENLDYLKTTNGKKCPDGETFLSFGGNHSCK